MEKYSLRFFLPCLIPLAFLVSGCEHLIDSKKVLGDWVVRKDSTEMDVKFTGDSLRIEYMPENLHYVYSYQWKQDEDPGMIECYQQSSLVPASGGQKITSSRIYILRASDDSISLFIPQMKTRFDLGRKR